jgi:hypothetical protein
MLFFILRLFDLPGWRLHRRARSGCRLFRRARNGGDARRNGRGRFHILLFLILFLLDAGELGSNLVLIVLLRNDSLSRCAT